jgi:[protein-PII] uridylyltransferase
VLIRPSYTDQRADLLARPGLTGSGRRAALADLTDAWLTDVFAEAGGPGAGAALVAIGGHGRRELSPGSDLDLALLLPHRGSKAEVRDLADRLWYPIWDSGVSVDHSVRTVPEARRVAAEDLRALLGLLDARHIVGEVALTDQLRSQVLGDWRALASRRLPDLLASSRERAQRAGDVAFSLQPELKEGRGGLRDLAVLRAVAASWVADAPHEGLAAAQTTLLDVRDTLHLVTARRTDRLVLHDQQAVAAALGLPDEDVLLRRVSGAARAIAYASDLTWARVERAIVTRGRRRTFLTGPRRTSLRSPLADGVVEQDGEVVLARDARPGADPVLVLRAAAAAAQAGLRLSPYAVERLAAESAELPQPWPAAARDALVSLLGAGPALVPVWEALDQAGLVVRLLPEWERVRFRPQRNPVHRYTVDRHLVECAVHASALARRVRRPDLLMLGALFHDIGKGWPGDHTDAGVHVVRELAPRLGLAQADVETLAALVRDHLLLPDTATRRDLDDPATLAAVLRAVDDVGYLELLHALTEADALATGPLAWSEWKASLVGELVSRVRAHLAGEQVPEPPIATPDQIKLATGGGLALDVSRTAVGHDLTVAAPDRIGLLAVVAGTLALHRLQVRAASTMTHGSTAVQVWSVQPEYGDLPAVERIREDLRRALDGSLDVAARLSAREAAHPVRGPAPPPPRVDVVDGASAQATVIEVRAHDRPGLLHRIGQALADHGADVRAARVSTLGSEVVDVFYVVGPDRDPLSSTHADAVRSAVVAALR